MSFDEIPEDKERSHKCHICGGNITKEEYTGLWKCDNCDFSMKEK